MTGIPVYLSIYSRDPNTASTLFGGTICILGGYAIVERALKSSQNNVIDGHLSNYSNVLVILPIRVPFLESQLDKEIQLCKRRLGHIKVRLTKGLLNVKPKSSGHFRQNFCKLAPPL